MMLRCPFLERATALRMRNALKETLVDVDDDVSEHTFFERCAACMRENLKCT